MCFRFGNLCFGGRYRNRLFMAASTAVYSLYVNTQGAPGGLTPETPAEHPRSRLVPGGA